MTTHDPGHDRFDRAMRALHADAVAQVSAGTTAQLHRRRHAALSAKPARGFRWPLAVACSSALALALGLGFMLQGPETPAPAQPQLVQADTGASADIGLESALASLDENPDFYLWLASDGAELLAME